MGIEYVAVLGSRRVGRSVGWLVGDREKEVSG